eukprot:gb/GECG01013746.1/.p1 GENE.gb/GECG01013746.1/~~gb/GECG01013746.1/.p1  ORF type:complete len:120 (+),score=5.09 gb/GECG01013746.1/:1-360(+)
MRHLPCKSFFRGEGAESTALVEEARSHFDKSLLTAGAHESPTFYGWEPAKGSNAPHRTATILSNCRACIPTLEECVNRSWVLLQSGAYLYQYVRWGLRSEDFQSAITRLLILLSMYSSS